MNSMHSISLVVAEKLSVFCRDANKLYSTCELKINQTGRLFRIGATPAQRILTLSYVSGAEHFQK
jgi:hypothetical protein